jgi:hypothetical protein
MKLIVEVEDQKADFFLELLKQLKFVKVKPLTPYKTEILEGIKEAVEQVNLAKEGKIKLKSARDLLDEL